MDVRLTWTDCDEAGDYVVPKVLSPRDLVSRPDNMNKTVLHTQVGQLSATDEKALSTGQLCLNLLVGLMGKQGLSCTCEYYGHFLPTADLSRSVDRYC